MFKRNIIKYNQPSSQLPPNPMIGDMWWQSDKGRVCRYTQVGWQCSLPLRDNRGYIAGGTGSNNYQSIIEKVEFPFDNSLVINIGNLTESKYNMGSYNSSIFGYTAGGKGINTYSTIDKISFASPGNAIVVAYTTITTLGYAGCNSSLHGYILGGQLNISTIQRITLSTDSVVTDVGTLSVGTHNHGACNSTNYGYSIGGHNLSVINRLTFPFNSGVAKRVGSMSVSEGYMTASTNSSIHGFRVGGSDSLTTIDRLFFPFDSGVAILVGNTSLLKQQTCCVGSVEYALIVGSSRIYYTSIEKLIFPFDSGVTVVNGNLSSSRGSAAATDNTDGLIMFV